MQAAHFADEFGARTQKKMVGIGEDDLRAEGFEGLLRESFYAAQRSDRHERGRVNHAMRRFQTAKARTAGIGTQNFKAKRHPPSVSGKDSRKAGLDEDVDHPYADDPCERRAHA